MKIYLSLCLCTTMYAGEVNALPSFQGFKGAINTPNASIYKEGEFAFLYNNQVDNLKPSSKDDYRDNKRQNNHILSMGVVPNLDLNIRYANATKDGESKTFLEDRVVNFKYQLPFIPKELLEVAVGIQDIGGGASHLTSQYAVMSKEFNNIRTSIGYAKGEGKGSLDGPFGSIEYQATNWLNLAGEYDTHDWNAALKAHYATHIGKQQINFGVMAKSSKNYNKTYLGLYADLPFYNKSKAVSIKTEQIPSTIEKLNSYGFSNIAYTIKDDTLYFEYENTLYAYNDIDALGVVLGVLTMSNKASNIVVTPKKANIRQFSVHISQKSYQEFLKNGHYRPSLLQFSTTTTTENKEEKRGDRFKPLLTLKPDFLLIDGSELSSLDYTLAMQAELSLRLAKGTILSTRYNIPLAISENFKDGKLFDYRNRNKTKAEIDQILLSQYFQIDLPYRWISQVQIGRFDRKLTGASFETAITTPNGKHTLSFKGSKLKDDMYKIMDRYYQKDRDVELYAYRYYLSSLDADLKVTAGDFLYGDSGAMLSLKRYFSDLSVRFDISKTEHIYKGDNTVAKLSISVPFGPTKRVKTKYLDIQGDYLTYTRRKTVVSKGQASYTQPLHMKEVDNSFTLEKYYLNNSRFHPAYIKKNFNRLRNVFLENR